MEIYIKRDDGQFGPFTPKQIEECLESGALIETDIAWHAALPDWVPVTEVLDTLESAPAQAPAESVPAKVAKSGGSKKLLIAGVAAVLVLGAAAAVLVPKFFNDGEDGNAKPPKKEVVANTKTNTPPKNSSDTTIETVPVPGGTTFTPPPQPSGPSTTTFTDVTQHLDAGGTYYSYVSREGGVDAVKLVVDLIGPMLESQGVDELKPVITLLRNIYNESGIKEISGVGASSYRMESGIMRNAVMVHHRVGKDTGLLWKLMGGPAHDLDGLKLMPANTALALHGDLDLATAWDWLKAFIAKQDPSFVEDFTEAMADIEQNLPLEKMMQSFGGEVCVSLVVNPKLTVDLPISNSPVVTYDSNGTIHFKEKTIDVPQFGFVVALKVKDSMIYDLITEQGFSQGVNQEQMNGVTMWVQTEANTRIPGFFRPPGVKAPAEPANVPMLSPTFMQSSGYLILTTHKNLATEILAVQAGQSEGLRGTKAFKQVTDGLALKGNHLIYLSPVVRQTMMKLAGESIAMQQSFQDPKMREAMTNLVNYAGNLIAHQVVLAKRLPEGLLVDNRTTGLDIPSLQTGAGQVAASGILASLLLPKLVKAKARANSMKSANNARQLMSGLRSFATDNDGNLPEANRWCDAILSDMGTGQSFQSPQLPPGRPEPDGKRSDYALNIAAAGKNLNELAPDTVLVFECPLGWNGSGGLSDIQFHRLKPWGSYDQLQSIAVTLVDGSVHQATFAELEKFNWTGQRR